jgi:NAD(P)-dependent dehydrogenase (short-subunit alcohol dehydrogenase family)
MDFGLKGRVAWVTGAGGALGATIATTLAAEGCRLVLSGRKRTALEETARAIAAVSSEPVQIEIVDLSRRDEVDAAAERIADGQGRIDLLVNSAASPTFGSILDLSDADWETVIQVKLLGYMRVLRATLPVMVRQNFGRIVNISGRGGRQPTPAHLPGCSVNAAVHVLTKGLADVYGKHNIRINAVAPGPIESGRLAKIAASNQAVDDKGGGGGRAGSYNVVPVGRLGTAQEIADAVAFLLSERSSYITGTIQAVDGGGTVSI